MSPHSRSVTLAGKHCYLRFTLSALAQMSEHFDAKGPQALARLFAGKSQVLDVPTTRILLRFLLQAEQPREAQIISETASKTELSQAMSVVAELFEKAFFNG